MKQNEITINVLGVAGSGKTTVQLLISEVLKEYGFEVEIQNNDFTNEAQLRKHMNFNPEDRLNATLKKTKKITIIETQLGRPVK